MLVDSHAHLEAVDDLDDALERAKGDGVGKIITIGTSLKSSRKAIEIAQKFSVNEQQIYATCGFHPQDAKGEIEKLGLLHCFETLKEIAQSAKKTVAIGECGLDYYLPGDKKLPTVDKDKKFQRELFEGQIELATDLKLPLVIHCRNAWTEIFDLISNFKLKITNFTGVFHSWTGDWEAAKRALDLGYYISFSGIVTYNNALEIQEVAKKMPLNRMLIETDSPFLAPEPLRSGGPPKLISRLSTPPFHEKRRGRLEERNRRVKQNEPKNVKITANFIATLRNQPIDQIIKITAENSQRLFGI